MEKSKARLFIENLWYHEKAKIIIFGVVIVFLIFCLTQCLQKHTPDVYLLYAGAEPVNRSVVNSISENMKTFIPEDYNKDGVKTAYFEQYQFERGKNEAAQKSFDTEIFGGNTVILFLSPDNYKYCLENNYLVTLKSALGYVPEIAKDDYSIEFFDLECCTEMGANMLPDDTLVCIASPRGNEKKVEYNDQISFFKYMIKYDMK